MNANLRILLLEDSPADARLIERELCRDGFNFFMSRVRTESELRHELAAAPPDLVLSNHRLTELDGFRALAIVHQLWPRLPFIFVSGSNDQQMVCDMYEEGANDYVFKRDLRDLRSAVAKASGIEPDSAGAPAAGEEPQDGLLPQLFNPACGYLSLCPHCHQSRDEAGQVVPIEDYCHHRIESLVIRKLCEQCSLIVLGAGEPPKKASRSPKRAVS
jgi:CheY-like chemotaxis protein